jgi:hypothetical protein
MKGGWSAVILAAACLAAGPGDKVRWEKPDASFAAASVQNKLICWFFTTGEAVKGEPAAGC